MKMKLSALAALCLSLPAMAADRLVPSQYPTIQAAVNAAQSGDNIVVSAGLHAAQIDISGKSITLVGAGADRTFVDGLSSTRLLSISNVPSPGVTIRDLAFRNGMSGDDGAGILILNSRAKLTRCAIVDCVASRDVGCAWCNPVSLFGGGVYIGSGSHVTIQDSEISRNQVKQSFFAWGAGGEIGGAGIYVVGALVELERVQCKQNQLVGNDYPPPANNNDIRGFGAGIHARDNATLTLLDCVIEANAILGDRCDAGHGAGLYCLSSTLSVNRTAILANVSRSPHGLNEGAGVWFSGGSGDIVDSRLWLNFASSGAAAEPGSGVFAGSGGLSLRNSDLCGSGAQPISGTWSDQGNVTLSNFCIDCNANGVLDNIDVASGNSTDVNDSGVPDECECLGDILPDGRIDGADLGAVLTNWGPVTGSAWSRACDIDNDGIVSGPDLGLMLSNWGNCPN